MSQPRLLFLIRHGRSDFDSNDLGDVGRGPQWDPPLGERGREQAELLARRLLLMNPRPVAVYSSTMRRARETIAPYLARSGSEATYLDDLAEAHVGDWENRGFEELLASDETLLHAFRTEDSMWSTAPGSEPVGDLRRRVGDAIDRIVAAHPDGNVAVVCHGGVINAYLGPLLGLTEQAMFFLPENTSVNTVTLDGEDRIVRFLNDVRHVTEPRLYDDDT
ncbi:MAG: histidine phosphatase family protein [Actinomycetota bacterium]